MTKLFSRMRGHQPDAEALSAYLDGRLEGPASQRLEAHLAGCPACQAQLDGLRRVQSALAAMPAPAPPRSFRLRAVDVELMSAPGPSRLPRAMPVLAAAAVVVFAAVIVGGNVVGRGGGDSDSGRSALQASRSMTENFHADSAAGASEAAPTPADGFQNAPPSAADAAGEDADAATGQGIAAEPTAPGAGVIAPEKDDDARDSAPTALRDQLGRVDGSRAEEEAATEAVDDDGADGAPVREIILAISAAAAAVAGGIWIWSRRRQT